MAGKAELIGYLRNLPDDDALIGEIQALVDGFQPPYIPGAPKPQLRRPVEPPMINGRVNPAYLVELRDVAVDHNAAWQAYLGRQWPGFKDQVALISKMAEQSGIDLASYAPEVFSLTDIKTVDDVVEALDVQLSALEARIENSHEIGLRLLDTAKKKRWARVFRRTRALRRLCREATPKRSKPYSQDEAEVWKYLHPLRYMLWTTRSHLMTDDGALDFIETPPHLVMACLVATIAEAHAATLGIDGVLIVIPPRHGKTSLLVDGIIPLDLNLNPHNNEGIVHHNAEHARRRFLAVRDHFDNTTDKGRRRRTLFPTIALDESDRKNKSQFFVLVDGKRVNTHKEGNLSPWGVHSQAQGLTFHRLRFDDPSDQKEQMEEGTRARTNAAISSTWFPRLTGRSAFFTYICTRWHPEDFCGVLLGLAKKGDLNLAYFSLACGGPDEDFKPIWPEAGYDEEYLSRAYARLGQADFSCQYKNDPDSKAARRVKLLRCYDRVQWDNPTARSPAYHRFFADPATTYFLSVDPSGTDSKTSCLAGVTYAAFGHFRDELPDKSTIDVLRLLFLRYWSLHASQHDIAELIANFHRTNRVDKILVETVGGFHATAEALTVVHGIPASKIIRRQAGRGSKADRLLNYAIHLEAGDALIPGEWAPDERDTPVLQVARDWGPLALQLLRAGTTKHTNLLDCVRQQLEEVSPDIYHSKAAPAPPQPTAVSRRAQFFAAVAGALMTPTQRRQAGRGTRQSPRLRNPSFMTRKYTSSPP
jgi:hypothetical protein